MARSSNIEWTDSTVNFWWGCTKVGPGCDHCYAETWSQRFGDNLWGAGVPRRKIKSAVALLHRLNRDSERWEAATRVFRHAAWERGAPACGLCLRQRVFIQSMSDLFDNEVPLEWFAEAWQTIERCDRLHIQIVTKRVSAVEKRLAEIGRAAWPRHAGLMITVCNQAEADRDIPRLLALKDRIGIPWVGLSMEPLLGPVDLTRIDYRNSGVQNALTGSWSRFPIIARGDRLFLVTKPQRDHIDWVIVGGESGADARPMHPDWARSIRDQCKAANAPFFFKQWGEWAPIISTGGPEAGAGALVAHTIIYSLDKTRVRQRGWYAGHGSGRQSTILERIGKAHAGRLLDGVEHNAMPRAFE